MSTSKEKQELDKYSLTLAVIAEYNRYFDNLAKNYIDEKALSLEMWCLLKTETKI